MENNNEIDLLELLVRVINYLKKYLWLYVGSIAFGIVIAFFVFYTGDKLYKANIIITTNETDGILFSLFESLSDEIDDDNISKSLNISEDVARQIVNIDIDKIKPLTEEVMGVARIKEYYKISVILKDSSIFNQIKNGFKYYAENNVYLKSLNEFDKTKRLELINNINDEILKFDSVRYKNIKSNVVINNGIEFKNGIVYLYEKKNDLERKNKFSNIFEIIKDFNVVQISNVKTLLLKYVFGMLFIAFIFSFSIETKKTIKKYS